LFVKKVVFAVAVLVPCSFSFAQTPSTVSVNRQAEVAAALAQQSSAETVLHSLLATSTCSFTFTSGAGETFQKFCVTANGNITQFEAPQGKEHIAVGAVGEGYGICDFSHNVSYTDYADFGDSGNWNPATLVSQTAKSVKIARTTSDGIWTLTQTITQVTGNVPSAKVAMTLKNNSGISRIVFLLRYADVDAGGVFLNSLDATNKSAFGWNSRAGGNPFGLLLQNAVPTSVSHQGFTQTVPQGPDPCDEFTHLANGTQTGADGSIAMDYAVNLAKGASTTVTVAYKGL
jgi:hypothetical protein